MSVIFNIILVYIIIFMHQLSTNYFCFLRKRLIFVESYILLKTLKLIEAPITVPILFRVTTGSGLS